MMRRSIACLAVALGVGACLPVAHHPYPHHPHHPHHPRQHAMHVPYGHAPPPGWCRVWHPHRPPGHQPPPGPCHYLSHRVPPGAVLLVGR